MLGKLQNLWRLSLNNLRARAKFYGLRLFFYEQVTLARHILYNIRVRKVRTNKK